MEVSFNEEFFDRIIGLINRCVNRYYEKAYPSDKMEFRPCCTPEEKELLKKAIGIVKQNVSLDWKTIYGAVIFYYYNSIIFEYYITKDYDNGEIKCLKTKSPGINRLIRQITISDEEWAKEIRRLLNNLPEVIVSGGKKKKEKRRKTYRRGNKIKKTYKHKRRTYKKRAK